MSRLERLLRPKSIAVIGGGAFGANVVQQCLRMGFSGDIWPVHPKKDEVEGVKAYRTVADLPGAPDATFIGVNRNLTIEMVKALRVRGAGAAICFASGFRETGHYDPEGEGLQKALIEAAGAMPILGPNCYGLINYADGALLWPDQHGGQRLAPGARGAAIITQSSNIACNLTMQKRGLPVAFLMTAGNQAQTGLSEMALGLIEDERVSCLGLHIEGFDSAAGFERLAARARELKKPIVAMKVGRSEQARAGAVSHTASLAGSDTASDAFLRRLGIARVHSIPSFLETLKLLHAGGPLIGYTLSSMSCSGGEASVMADGAEGRRVSFPALAEDHRAQVKSTLGPLVAVANPLDYHTFIWNNEPAMTATFTAMVSGGFDLNMLVLDFPRTDRCSDADWWSAVRAFDSALKASGARGAIVASMLENLPEEHAAELFRRDIVPLHGIVEAMDAAEAAGFIGEAWKRPLPSRLEGEVPANRAEVVAADGFIPPFALPGISPSRGEIGSSSLAVSASTLTVGETSSDGVISPLEGEMPGRAEGGAPSVTSAIGAAPAAGVISPLEGEMPGRAEGVASEGTSYAPSTAAATPPGPSGHPPLKGEGNLDEASAKSLLAKADVSVPAGRRATSIEEAAAAAEAIGYPVALKALGVAHKSEAGAVKLNLRDAETVRKAAAELLPLGTGIYVERMVQGGVAELIVGFTSDPLFGPVMTLGSGGVLVELLKDSATLLLPASRDDVESALRGLKLFPLLDGFRGRPKADLDAAIDAVLALAGFVSQNADAIEELDINPLIVCAKGQGAWVADALMVTSSTPPSHLRGGTIGKADRGGVASVAAN